MDSRPKLAFGLENYYNNFWNLNTERVVNEVIPCLPWSCIQSYADYYEMGFEESERFHYLMRKMDDAYVKSMRENGKPKQDKPIDTRKPTGKRSKVN